ncbi:MAG: S8 family serine peptidase [bacterium]
MASKKSLIALLLILLTGSAFGRGRIEIPTALQQGDSLKIWVYFTDKGSLRSGLSPAIPVTVDALERRARRGADIDYDYYDTPVNPDYITAVSELALSTRVQSRWLNAVSVWITPGALQQIAELPFVDKLTPVAQYKRSPVIEQPPQRLEKPQGSLQLDYGPSFNQLDMIGVVELHEQGYTGAGVNILMLDTGFKLSHEAFAHLDVDSTWDFINGDVDVEDAADADDDQQSHGTSTLSLIGAYAPDSLIGAAYNATFLLAKTERRSSSSEAEIADADDWIAGAEWGEPLGAEVLSSSLGYDDRAGYSYEELDGNTAEVTIAADLAAALGVMVVNSMGNDGRSAAEPTLIAPADGDSVIAVGAVDPGGNITSFSSNGPTADGRIKPDVCAEGSGVRIASYLGGYSSFGSGTSFSCPLTAGAVALILEVHPDWTYGTIYNRLTSTASRANSPDTVYGFGIIDVAAAIGDEVLPTVSNVTVAPNPFDGSVNLLVPLETVGLITVRIYTIAAEEVIVLEKQALNARTIPVTWNGVNADGEPVANGVYLAHVIAPGIDELVKLVKISSGD